MSNNYLRGYCERSADSADQMGTAIRFVASSEGVKRDGLTIDAAGWQLDEFRANPAILWSHDYWGERPPIGRAEKVEVVGNRLMADIVFDPADPFAVAVERKYRTGFLNSVSVGFDILENENNRATKTNLIDISAVNIPGDPDALMERQARGFRDLGQRLLDLTDDPADPKGDDAEAVWVGTALRMVRLIHTAAEDGAVDQREYRRIERAYQRLGKVAPEVPDHIDALDIEGIRGLFLAGEPDLVPELFRVPSIITTNDDWWGE